MSAPLPMCIVCDCPVHHDECHGLGALDAHRGGVRVNLCPDCYKQATRTLVQYTGPTEDPVPELDGHESEARLRGHS